MKLAIVGSRDFNNYELLKSTILGKFNLSDINEIVSGGARGADTLADKFSEEFDIDMVVFEAEWDKYGRSAGPKRNKMIVEYCDELIAFWDGKSTGTNHSITYAKSLNKKVDVILVQLLPGLNSAKV